ncbi:MAG TPA: phytoene/squalene synthase family protein [Gemmataceae bacterium]|nr:phytoene/squalene synthase family protein [Gemmataceae bacterium]
MPPPPLRPSDDRTRLARSYYYCEHLARREAGNFYHAFRLLPRDQRRAMCALYAFMRVADDLADEPGDAQAKRAALADWRQQLHEALAGHCRHRLHPALHDTVARHRIPAAYLLDVLDGVVMDLDVTRYESFADLYRYCYRVASAVGLTCIHVWGFTDPKAKEYAEAAGIAFQLTNILRDLREDAERGRCYLPAEDLARFGYGFDALRRGERTAAYQALMRFEAERARGYYRAAEPLAGLLPAPGRAVFLVMLRTYRGLLDEIVRRDYDVFAGRVRLGTWRKLWLVARALPVRWGWA